MIYDDGEVGRNLKKNKIKYYMPSPGPVCVMCPYSSGGMKAKDSMRTITQKGARIRGCGPPPTFRCRAFFGFGC